MNLPLGLLVPLSVMGINTAPSCSCFQGCNLLQRKVLNVTIYHTTWPIQASTEHVTDLAQVATWQHRSAEMGACMLLADLGKEIMSTCSQTPCTH